MPKYSRRDALKTLSATALAAAGSTLLGRPATAYDPKYPIEKGAELRVLRWKRFVQGDEDQWMANTRKFTELTGVPVRVDSENFEDIRPKAAVAANVGSGPDIVYGLVRRSASVCRQTARSDRAGRLSRWQVRRLVRHRASAIAPRNGRWIAIAHGLSRRLHRLSAEHDRGRRIQARFRAISRAILKLLQALKAKGTPCGFALGNAVGDANAWCHWVVWAHGGRMVDEHNKVVINSKETHRRARLCQGHVRDLHSGHAVVARSEQQQSLPGRGHQPHAERHLDLLRSQEIG